MAARVPFRSACARGVLLVSLWAAVAHGQARARHPAIGFLQLEPLGLDAERALRLEALFRAELERLSSAPLPSRSALEAVYAKEPGLRSCTGEPPCLAAVGKKLGVAAVVGGNVGALGDSYVVNLKLVDVASGTELRRVSEKLSGSSDQLIDAVRVAAYSLVAPDELRGSLSVLSDVTGASVALDGRKLGTTPLPGPIGNVGVGKHALRLEAEGFSPAVSEVDVHFQKTSEVVVKMIAAAPAPGNDPRAQAPRRWYNSPWTWVAVGAGAILAGVLVGRALGSDQSIDCGKSPEMCRP
jgi:PEGA domain